MEHVSSGRDERLQAGLGRDKELAESSGRARNAPAQSPGLGGGSPCLPEGGAFGPRDLQEVVPVLQLEVDEDQGDGVPQLGQDGPRAVGIVVVLGGEVGAGDDAALPPQGPATGVVRCRHRDKRLT